MPFRILKGPFRYVFLFTSMVVLLVVLPFLPRHHISSLLFQIILTWAMLAAVFAAGERKRNLLIGLFLVIPAIFGTWTDHQGGGRLFLAIQILCDFFFFFFAAVVMLTTIIRARTVTLDMIFGTACAYLLFGTAWAFCYVGLEAVMPGSFNMPMGDVINWQKGDFFHFLYFSFVTLTTLGYGDITPATSPAQMICSLEALFGQLYLAILVARMVGLHIMDEQAAPPPDAREKAEPACQSPGGNETEGRT